jgi:nucleotidyltransferase/DNA polymerase involved in DNA repair
MKQPIAISGSANFHGSAEKIFDTTLKNVPVIVLSNNDGCAVARSDAAKTSKMRATEASSEQIQNRHCTKSQLQPATCRPLNLPKQFLSARCKKLQGGRFWCFKYF